MTRGRSRALLVVPLAVILALGLASCSEDTSVVAPSPVVDPPKVTDTQPEALPEDGPPASPAISSTAYQSSDRCSIPALLRGRYRRVLDTGAPGIHELDAAHGWSSCTESPEDVNNHFAFAHTDEGWAWSASVPVSAVVFWSGEHAMLHLYDGTSGGDEGLLGPVDPVTGTELAVDGVTLVHDYQLLADLSFDNDPGNTIDWNVDFTVEPASWDLFPGDRATSRAVIDVERVDSEGGTPRVRATVEIANRSPFEAQLADVYALIGSRVSRPAPAPSLPRPLAPGETLTVTIEEDVPSTAAQRFVLYVNATGPVPGQTIRTEATFDAPVEEIELVTGDGEIIGPLDGSQQVVLEKAIAVDASSPASQSIPWSLAFANGGDAIAATAIDVRMHTPAIQIDLTPQFTRAWNWALDLEQAGDPVETASGVQVPLRITSTAASASDQDHRVTGTVALVNPHPTRALDVTSILLDVGGAQSSIVLDAPIAATARAAFDVDLALAGAASAATVSFVRPARDYAWDGSWTPASPVPASQASPVVFGAPTAVVDGEAQLDDTHLGDLGPVHAGAGATITDVAIPWDPTARSEPRLEGRVRLVTNDRGETMERAYSIDMAVDGDDPGCTLRAWQWRRRGNDPVWEMLPDGAKTKVFDSRLTWYDALRPSFRWGLWGMLAREYVASQLNVLAGADPTDAQAWMDEAAEILQSTDRRSLRGTEARRAVRLMWMLGRYNAGRVGPGSCGR